MRKASVILELGLKVPLPKGELTEGKELKIRHLLEKTIEAIPDFEVNFIIVQESSYENDDDDIDETEVIESWETD